MALFGGAEGTKKKASEKAAAGKSHLAYYLKRPIMYGQTWRTSLHCFDTGHGHASIFIGV